MSKKTKKIHFFVFSLLTYRTNRILYFVLGNVIYSICSKIYLKIGSQKNCMLRPKHYFKLPLQAIMQHLLQREPDSLKKRKGYKMLMNKLEKTEQKK